MGVEADSYLLIEIILYKIKETCNILLFHRTVRINDIKNVGAEFVRHTYKTEVFGIGIAESYHRLEIHLIALVLDLSTKLNRLQCLRLVEANPYAVRSCAVILRQQFCIIIAAVYHYGNQSIFSVSRKDSFYSVNRGILRLIRRKISL